MHHAGAGTRIKTTAKEKKNHFAKVESSFDHKQTRSLPFPLSMTLTSIRMFQKNLF